MVKHRLKFPKVGKLFVAAALDEEHRDRNLREVPDRIVKDDAPAHGEDIEHQAANVWPMLT